jgi:soluble lytic murein transglycosylase
VIQNYPDHRFWDDAWEQKAYTQWAYQDQFNQAITTLLDFVATSANHPRAGEFLYDAAQVAERDGQLARAADLWDQVSIKYPNYENAPRSLFLAGICRYRLKDYPAALQSFGVYLAQAVSLDQRAAAALWRGKTQAAVGDQAAAQADWRQAANIDPTGYYSERARDLLRGREPFTPPQAFDFSRDLQSERREAEDWLRTTFSLDGSVDLSSPGPLQQDGRFQRGTELWKLGLYDEARVEFEDLRQSISTDAAASYRLANYLMDLGIYRSAILAARQVLDLAGMDDASTLNAPVYFNHLRFGTYFSELILSQAEAHNFHPLFLYSLVRQESAFEGFVRSSAGARGLMQIVPATGQEIVDSLNWPPDYTPRRSLPAVCQLALGASYLDKWRDHFQGDLYTALAAYNGGPGNAAVWMELAGDDPDLFLEIVRFEETRNYIRGISEIFSIYRRLYDRSP